MTREEAIDIIQSILDKYEEDECLVTEITIGDEDIEALKLAIKALKQQPCPTCKYGVLGKITNFFQNWDCDENAKLEISVRDMREISSMFITKCRAESKLKTLKQSSCEDRIIEWEKDFKEYVNSLSMPRDDYKGIMEYIDELPITSQQNTGNWISVKFRPLTDEEQEEYPDYCYMADCPMPDDGEEILVSTKNGRVEKDECRFDDGFYLDSGYDWQTDIVAWMPSPKPYEPQAE